MAEKTYIDVNVLIYWLTMNSEFGETALEWVVRAEESNGDYMTSALSVYEAAVIIAGLRGTNPKDQALIGQVTASITDLNGLRIIPLTIGQAVEAPFFMRQYNLDFEDALHLAAAMEYNSVRIVSNDRDFDRTPMSRVF